MGANVIKATPDFQTLLWIQDFALKLIFYWLMIVPFHLQETFTIKLK